MSFGSCRYSNYIICTLFLAVGLGLLSCNSIKKIERNKDKNISETFKPCILDYPGKPAGSPERENLGDDINSKCFEILPIISADGKTLYFIRGGHPANLEGAEHGGDPKSQDIWISELINGKWQEAYNPGASINNKYPNGVCYVSPDGTTLLLNNRYKKDGTLEDGFSITHKYLGANKKTVWSFPENQLIVNYYNLSKFTSANLSSDGKILFLGMERKDSKGDLDLYFSRKIGENKWSEPKNLGDIVNTPGIESTPFLAADGKTLYFSSNGHCTYGDLDIFYTKRLDDTWTNWSEPVNLGPEINSPEPENGYFLTAKGDYAYFYGINKRTNGKSDFDLFRIKMPEEAQPEPVYLITGTVLNQDTKEIMDATIYYDDRETGAELGNAKTDPETGIYKIVLPKGKDYAIRAYVEGCMAMSKTLSSKDLDQFENFELDLTVNPVVKNKPIVIDNIYFDFGQFELKKESYYELNNISVFLQNNEKINVEIAGHTDNVGSDEDNMILSKNRAKSVVEYFLSKGIDKSRISYVGYGETKPIADNSTDEGREKNRRVELEFVD